VVLAEPGFLTPELGDRFVSELETRTEFSFEALWTALSIGAQALKLKVPEGDEDARLDFLALALAQTDLSANPMRAYYCGGVLEKEAMPMWRFGIQANIVLLESARDEEGKVSVDFSDGIERFEREVLLIASSCNQVMGASVQKRHRDLFPQARLVVMQDVGHAMLGEAPEESVRIISEYFAQP
jgi:proline iminopeptidase